MHRSYSRNFITLKQERDDFTEHGRQSLGSCIIEYHGKKGKINATIQHLKPEYIYKLCLIAADANVALCIKASTFDMSKNSRGETKFSFDTDNVFETNMPIEAFNVVTVICIKDKNSYAFPLVGYVDNPVPWKDKLIFFDKDNNNKPIKQKDDEIKKTIHKSNIQLEIKEDIKPQEKTDICVNKIKEKIEDEEIKLFEKESSAIFETILKQSVEDNNTKNNVSAIPNNTAGPYATEKDFFDTFYSNTNTKNIVKKATENKIADTINDDLNNINNNIKSDIEDKSSNPDYVFDFISDEPVYTNDTPTEDTNDNMHNNDYDNNNHNDNIPINFHEIFKSMAKKFHEELEELTAYSVLSDEELDALDHAKKAQAHENIDSNELEIIRIFNENIKTYPFDKNNKSMLWVLISIEDLEIFPFDYDSYINSPFLSSSYYKYRHLIVGKSLDVHDKRYILGVPNAYSASSKSVASGLNFNEFKPCGDSQIGEGVYGYWLMTI